MESGTRVCGGYNKAVHDLHLARLNRIVVEQESEKSETRGVAPLYIQHIGQAAVAEPQGVIQTDETLAETE